VTEDRDNLSELPSNWELTSLGNLFCWSNGKNLTKQKMEEGSYCVYGGNGIAGHHNQWLSEEQSIIVGRVGAQCGNVHLAPSHSWITDNAIYTSWKTNHIYLKFFYYLLGNFKLNELAGGSGQPYISQTILNPLLIPLPPLNEQRRIVAKIEALKARSQRVKEELEAIAPLLDQFRQSVLAAAFRGDLTADWREKNPDVEPASVLLERIRAERCRCWEVAELEKMKAQGKTPKNDKWKEKYEEPELVDTEELPLLPAGWCWASVEQLVINYDSVRIPIRLEDRKLRQGKYPYYGAFGIIDQIDDYLFDGDHLLIAEDGKNLLYRNKPIAFLATGKFWVNNHAHVLQTLAGMPLNYLKSYFNSIDLTFYLTGMDQVKLTRGALDRIPVPVAPLQEQIVIESKVENCLGVRQNLFEFTQDGLVELDKLNQSILAKAFRGELVPQDPNDEPASVLLERIRAEREKLDTKKKAKGKTEKKSRKAKPEATEPEQLSLPGFE